MIKYIPNLDTLLWSFKSIEYFETMEEFKSFIADQRSRFCRFIGRPDKSFTPGDVTLSDPLAPDPLVCWDNYRSVHVDGVVIGYCGE